MELSQILQELNAQDGPNIPITTLGVYCGVSHQTISAVKNGKLKVSESTEQQIRQGLKELANEIREVVFQ